MGVVSLYVKMLAKSVSSKPPQLLVAGGTRATRLDVNATAGALAMPVNPDDLQDRSAVRASFFKVNR